MTNTNELISEYMHLYKLRNLPLHKIEEQLHRMWMTMSVQELNIVRTLRTMIDYQSPITIPSRIIKFPTHDPRTDPQALDTITYYLDFSASHNLQDVPTGTIKVLDYDDEFKKITYALDKHNHLIENRMSLREWCSWLQLLTIKHIVLGDDPNTTWTI